jgi:hypothetical protein
MENSEKTLTSKISRLVIRVPRTHMGKKTFSSTNGVGEKKWLFVSRRVKLDPCIASYIKKSIHSVLNSYV